MRNNKGFALILTLVVTALMVAVLTELIHQVYVDMSMSRGFRDGQQASLLAESGISGGMKLLQLSLQGKDYSALSDSWATPVKLDDETGSLEIAISDESGKININNLVQPNGDPQPFTQAALQRLGRRFQVPENTWNAVADWIDTNDQPRTNGAESPYYKSLRPAYAAHNGMLTTLAELSLVKGFTPEVTSKLTPFMTVYSAQVGAPISPVNINTASKEVLTALDDGIDDRMAERIMEERRLKPFKSPGELSRISGADVISQKLVGKVSVKGSLFRITAVAKVKETARAVEVVARISNSATDILYWQEY